MHIPKILILVLFIANVTIIHCEDESMLGKIKSGFAYAGKILGLDRAKEVARLVSDAFGRTSRKGDPGDPGSTLFSGFLRILGFDTKRIGAIAVNAIIFIAQIISTSLSKPPPAYVTEERKLDGTPLDWMLANSGVQHYLKYAKDVNLPNRVIEILKDKKTPERTGCLQLLICKSAPLVWGMQRALKIKGADVKKGMNVLTDYLPTYDQFADNGDACEAKYPYCKIPLT